MAALVYETRTRLGLMPVDRARKGYEEAGTYRVVVGFYPTYSPDGKRTEPSPDKVFEHVFPSLSACMEGVNALDKYYKKRGKSVQMKLLTPANIRAEEEARQRAKRLSEVKWKPLPAGRSIWEDLVAVDPGIMTRRIFEVPRGLVLESPAVVQLDGGLDRSREIGGSVVSAMEGNYQGAVDPCEHDDVKAERVRVGLWQTGSALDTLFYGPWEKRTSDKPESHPRASMKPDVTTHHSGS